MDGKRTGCLIALLVVTALFVVVALVAARVLLNWSERGEAISINLPFVAATATTAPAATATPKLLPATATSAPAVGNTPQAESTVEPAPTPPAASSGEPEAIILNDPSLSDLAGELTSVTSGQSISISMSEDALQEELTTYLAPLTESGYEFHSVEMESERLIIKGKGQMDALVVNFTVTVRPYVTDCWFVVEVEKVKLGKFPAPAFVNDEIQTYVNQWTEAYGNTEVFCVTDLVVTDERMILNGYVQ